MRSSVSTDDHLHHVYHCASLCPVPSIHRGYRRAIGPELVCFKTVGPSDARPSAVRPNGFSRSRFVISPRFIFIGGSHTLYVRKLVQVSNSVALAKVPSEMAPRPEEREVDEAPACFQNDDACFICHDTADEKIGSPERICKCAWLTVRSRHPVARSLRPRSRSPPTGPPPMPVPLATSEGGNVRRDGMSLLQDAAP